MLHGIDIRGHIDVMKIATPVTHWRYTGNRGGSLMGGRPTRPNLRNRVASYHTPVKNLLLGGH
jgi:prolycopene isomerase